MLVKQRERLWMTCPDLLLTDQPYPGLERLKARFHGHAYDPYRHETYAIGMTESGARRSAIAAPSGSVPAGCMTAMLGRRRASPTGCSISSRCWSVSRSASADHAVRRRRSRGGPAPAAVLAEAFETFPGALDPLALPAVIAALWRPLRSQESASRVAQTTTLP
jgi:hypothetical protein